MSTKRTRAVSAALFSVASVVSVTGLGFERDAFA